MKAGIKILIAITGWLALGSLFLLRTIIVDRAELDFDQLQRYESLANEPLLTGIRIAVTSDKIPDIAAVSQYVLNRQLEARRSPYRFVVGKECTADTEFCIDTRMGDEDMIGLNSGKTRLGISYSERTLIDGRVPEAVVMLMLEHVYKDEIIASTSPQQHLHEEVTLSYSPQYQITFNLFSEGGTLLDWDIGNAINNVLGPLLADINSEVASLTIDTQTGLYAEMTTTPAATENGERILEKSQLSTFVDFAEWKLASSLPYPTINFVLYVPESPLNIRDSTRAIPQFIIPQWGGVVIGHPKSVGQHVFTSEDLAPVLDIFGRQLLALLGLREPADQDGPSRPPAEVLLARLSRQYAQRGILGAASSLGSLRRLAIGMPNIAIPQQVAQRAETAMKEIDEGIALLAAGEHARAVANAQRAYSAADRAFFDKHMVAQAYFPDEHKVAVYTPLIGPFIVVVLSGWIRIIKQRKSSNKTSSETSSSLVEAEEKNKKSTVKASKSEKAAHIKAESIEI